MICKFKHLSLFHCSMLHGYQNPLFFMGVIEILSNKIFSTYIIFDNLQKINYTIMIKKPYFVSKKSHFCCCALSLRCYTVSCVKRTLTFISFELNSRHCKHQREPLFCCFSHSFFSLSLSRPIRLFFLHLRFSLPSLYTFSAIFLTSIELSIGTWRFNLNVTSSWNLLEGTPNSNHSLFLLHFTCFVMNRALMHAMFWRRDLLFLDL